MKKLSNQPYSYLCFEVARLRTRWDHDEENRSAIEKRYREVIKEFNSRTNNWFWTKHPIDKIVKGQAIQEKMTKAKHSFTECMDCKKAPEVEVLWAEGRAHAWFCKDCYEKWKRKKFELNGKMLTYESEVVKEREIDGEASKKWSKPVKKADDWCESQGGKWITIKGSHVCITPGESRDSAFKNFIFTRYHKPDELIESVKGHFGTMEIGESEPDQITYISADGEYLGGKGMHHGDVKEVLDEKVQQEISSEESAKYFQRSTGAVRVYAREDVMYVEVRADQKVSDKQWKSITEMAGYMGENYYEEDTKDYPIAYDVTGINDKSVKNGELPWEEAISNLKEDYETSKLGKALGDGILFNVTLKERIEIRKIEKADDWCSSVGGKWITVKGNHICLMPGQDPKDAFMYSRVDSEFTSEELEGLMSEKVLKPINRSQYKEMLFVYSDGSLVGGEDRYHGNILPWMEEKVGMEFKGEDATKYFQRKTGAVRCRVSGKHNLYLEVRTDQKEVSGKQWTTLREIADTYDLSVMYDVTASNDKVVSSGHGVGSDGIDKLKEAYHSNKINKNLIGIRSGLVPLWKRIEENNINKIEKAENWCDEAGGNWITYKGKHLCVNISDYSKVPEKIREEVKRNAFRYGKREASRRFKEKKQYIDDTAEKFEEDDREMIRTALGRYKHGDLMYVNIKPSSDHDFKRIVGTRQSLSSGGGYFDHYPVVGEERAIYLNAYHPTAGCLHHEMGHAIYHSKFGRKMVSPGLDIQYRDEGTREHIAGFVLQDPYCKKNVKEFAAEGFMMIMDRPEFVAAHMEEDYVAREYFSQIMDDTGYKLKIKKREGWGD